MNTNKVTDEEKRTEEAKAWRDTMLANIRKYKGYSEEQLREYVDEAEGQDGIEYWLQFKTWEELNADIRLYWTAASN
jgi:hypothetical protein